MQCTIALIDYNVNLFYEASINLWCVFWTLHKTSEYTKNSYVYEASIKITPNSESMVQPEPLAQRRCWRWYILNIPHCSFCDRAHIILSAFWIFIMTWRTQYKLSLMEMLHKASKESAWIKLNHDECFTRFGWKSVQWQYAWDVEILRREQFVLAHHAVHCASKHLNLIPIHIGMVIYLSHLSPLQILLHLHTAAALSLLVLQKVPSEGS